jgi:hypothetical protein
MGTRADFYLGRGPTATWLGSIAWDGHPETVMGKRKDDSKPNKLARAKTAEAFRRRLLQRMGDRDDFVQPPEPWPWPWPDSRITDHAYAFDEGTVWLAVEDDQGDWAWVPIADALARRAEPDDGAWIVITQEWLEEVVDKHLEERRNQTATDMFPRMKP